MKLYMQFYCFNQYNVFGLRICLPVPRFMGDRSSWSSRYSVWVTHSSIYIGKRRISKVSHTWYMCIYTCVLHLSCDDSLTLYLGYLLSGLYIYIRLILSAILINHRCINFVYRYMDNSVLYVITPNLTHNYLSTYLCWGPFSSCDSYTVPFLTSAASYCIYIPIYILDSKDIRLVSLPKYPKA